MSGVTGAVVASTVVGAGTAVYGANKAAGASSDAAKAANTLSERQFDIVRGDTAKLRGLGSSAIDRINRLYGYAPADERQVGSRVYKSSDVERLLKQGMSIDDILKLGIYNPGAKVSDTQRLMERYSLSPDDIQRLQRGTFTPAAGAEAGAGKPDMSAFFESPDYQFNLAENEKAINRGAAARGRYDSGAVRTQLSRNASGMASREFASFYDRLAQQAGLGTTGIGMSASAGVNAANTMGANIVGAGSSRASSYLAGAGGVNSAIQGTIGNYALMQYLKPQGAIMGNHAVNYGGPIYGGGLA